MPSGVRQGAAPPFASRREVGDVQASVAKSGIAVTRAAFCGLVVGAVHGYVV
jgi:hypothetical protein